ncbi:MAG: hypothetical protein QOJ03_869, partial [Frankiaceae bacterium]|nr:hypothetical protein [Frankiaceae bacterium]
MRKQIAGCALAIAALVAGCGSGESGGNSAGKTQGTPSSTSPSATRPAIVGRWQTLRTCQGLLAALRKAGIPE